MAQRQYSSLLGEWQPTCALTLHTSYTWQSQWRQSQSAISRPEWEMFFYFWTFQGCYNYQMKVGESRSTRRKTPRLCELCLAKGHTSVVEKIRAHRESNPGRLGPSPMHYQLSWGGKLYRGHPKWLLTEYSTLLPVVVMTSRVQVTSLGESPATSDVITATVQ